jgi:hypothetical protein
MARTCADSVLNLKHREAYERLLLHYARKGDWKDLASYVEQRRVDNRELRAFIGAIMRGKKRRPNNRAPTRERERDSFGRAASVIWAVHVDGMGREAAIDKAADETEVHRRTIQRDLEKHEHRCMNYLETIRLAEKFVMELKQAMPSLTSGQAWVAFLPEVNPGDRAAFDLWARHATMRYETDETALSQHFMS